MSYSPQQITRLIRLASDGDIQAGKKMNRYNRRTNGPRYRCDMVCFIDPSTTFLLEKFYDLWPWGSSKGPFYDNVSQIVDTVDSFLGPNEIIVDYSNARLQEPYTAKPSILKVKVCRARFRFTYDAHGIHGSLRDRLSRLLPRRSFSRASSLALFTAVYNNYEYEIFINIPNDGYNHGVNGSTCMYLPYTKLLPMCSAGTNKRAYLTNAHSE